MSSRGVVPLVRLVFAYGWSLVVVDGRHVAMISHVRTERSISDNALSALLTQRGAVSRLRMHALPSVKHRHLGTQDLMRQGVYLCRLGISDPSHGHGSGKSFIDRNNSLHAVSLRCRC